jgi:hypothetical protein
MTTTVGINPRTTIYLTIFSSQFFSKSQNIKDTIAKTHRNDKSCKHHFRSTFRKFGAGEHLNPNEFPTKREIVQKRSL